MEEPPARKRKSNMTAAQVTILLKALRDYNTILSSRISNAVTWDTKRNIWAHITRRVNENDLNAEPRTTKEVSKKWTDLRCLAVRYNNELQCGNTPSGPAPPYFELVMDVLNADEHIEKTNELVKLFNSQTEKEQHGSGDAKHMTMVFPDPFYNESASLSTSSLNDNNIHRLDFESPSFAMTAVDCGSSLQGIVKTEMVRRKRKLGGATSAPSAKLTDLEDNLAWEGYLIQATEESRARMRLIELQEAVCERQIKILDLQLKKMGEEESFS